MGKRTANGLLESDSAGNFLRLAGLGQAREDASGELLTANAGGGPGTFRQLKGRTTKRESTHRPHPWVVTVSWTQVATHSGVPAGIWRSWAAAKAATARRTKVWVNCMAKNGEKRFVELYSDCAGLVLRVGWRGGGRGRLTL